MVYGELLVALKKEEEVNSVKKDCIIHVRMDEEDIEKLNRLCSKEKESLSMVVRKLVRKGLVYDENISEMRDQMNNLRLENEFYRNSTFRNNY